MNICHIDIETTGLDPQLHQIVEIGAVMDGGEYLKNPQVETLPSFEVFVKQPTYRIDPYCMPAMAARAEKLKREGIEQDDALESLCIFIQKNRKSFDSVVFCGKNVGSFDWQFLKAVGIAEHLKDYGIKVSRRFMDVGSASVTAEDLLTGKDIPQLQDCLDRLGMLKVVPHTALADAQLCALWLRNHYKKEIEAFFEMKMAPAVDGLERLVEKRLKEQQA